MSDSLLESELFGHEKGAFTGAYAQRKGRFEMAHGGTLLLDEITETPPSFQAKLLRIIEQQEFERVGGNENIKVNVRIISTTNRDLLHEVQMGRFRQDLYYRLSAARIVLAPLRDRREDLPELVWHFVNLYAKRGPAPHRRAGSDDDGDLRQLRLAGQRPPVAQRRADLADPRHGPGAVPGRCLVAVRRAAAADATATSIADCGLRIAD